jgi:3-hydroxybutyryl-CoA dehydrogenase
VDRSSNVSDIKVGIVGLGLMGSCISVALAVSGHQVVALAPIEQDLANAPEYIKGEIGNCQEAGLIHSSSEILSRINITTDYRELRDCQIVFECVIEDLKIKKQVYLQISDQVSPDTIIASNTSALPISLLQQLVPHRERFLGIHWAEPAYLTRFMEITCGMETSHEVALWIYELAHQWNKEPTLLRKDIRGFITNRLMYALYREAIALAEGGKITFEDLDKCLKYDMGAWMTFMGIFRRLDYVGLNNYEKIINSIFITLCNDETVPPTMEQRMKEDARGTRNGKGIYNYINGESQAWENAFANFNRDIYNLAKFYPSNKVQKKSLK